MQLQPVIRITRSESALCDDSGCFMGRMRVACNGLLRGSLGSGGSRQIERCVVGSRHLTRIDIEFRTSARVLSSIDRQVTPRSGTEDELMMTMSGAE
jgi:hypothetical protein